MLWLWTLALYLPPACQAQRPNNSSGQTKTFEEAGEEFGYSTLKENESDRMWVTKSSNTPSDRSWGITTPPGVIAESTSVFEGRPPKATVTISSVNGTCNVTLNCFNTGGGENVTYAWSYSHKSVVLSEEQTLHITEKPEDDSWSFTCTVRSMERENSTSTVSLIGHCHDARVQHQRSSASFYAKYWVPALIVLVALLILFLMYRRKRGRASLSRTVSINESSDSDSGATLEMDPVPQAWKPIPEESPQTTGALATENAEETLDTQDQPLNQA